MRRLSQRIASSIIYKICRSVGVWYTYVLLYFLSAFHSVNCKWLGLLLLSVWLFDCQKIWFLMQQLQLASNKSAALSIYLLRRRLLLLPLPFAIFIAFHLTSFLLHIVWPVLSTIALFSSACTWCHSLLFIVISFVRDYPPQLLCSFLQF